MTPASQPHDHDHEHGPAARPGVVAWLLIGLVRLYQLTLAWALGGHCRFEPSCSRYALECLRTHGAFRGALLSVRRVSRCHPFSPGGYDPPPPVRTHGAHLDAMQADRLPRG